MLLRFEVVCVFVFSGWSKLIDPDWWGGTVTMIRFVDGREMGEASGVPAWVLDLAVTEGFNSAFAKVAVLTELAIGLGLVFRRTRLAALWLEVGFHVAIEVIFSVQVFSYAALAAMVIWITPSARDRHVIVRGAELDARLVERVVRWLDWTGRFVLRREQGAGPAVTLVDRDGRIVSGRTATWFVLTRLPATFPFAAPFYAGALLLDRFRSRKRPPALA